MRKGRVGILFGGLTAIMAVTIIQLLSIPKLDIALTFTVYSFAFALPASAFYTISAQEHLKDRQMDTPALYELVAAITLLAGSVGLGGIFFHFGRNPGVIFIVTSIIAIMTLNYISDNVKKLFLPIIDKKKIIKPEKRRNSKIRENRK